MTLSLESLAIHKTNGEALFSDLNISVSAQEVVCLMGPSGCGKSTLLSLIAGHMSSEFVHSGHVLLNGINLAELEPHQRQVGILFQDDLLFPHLNVWQNLAFALPNSIKGDERRHQAITALNKVELSQLSDSFPDQISGGQRARVSLLRMLLAKPKLALLDEPFSKLDKELRTQFRDWVIAQLVEANIPTLMVTHDKDDVPENGRILSWPWETTHHA
ncbi:ATP-binding cassette domain-containing protein [Vibrio neptunius]|uniref:ATP-binding cassette domain-containing protein n=1 Tax=Vibrio neptunius TaxID=170651 RepID=A0ABS3A1C5_9VIBR|nr:ATP-binding cassette domain-containing protein [Vibrio neptunius]KJY93359.1 ABC transporter ATP-binding protein [Vibrio neptunius]MBN3493037.1 ATP-binding cassette domain-containing protein [Vibrio neptunius]MBN3515533.1 ATP-binding cassette domain-containing protein [Vibrio neptunius]MBN3549569.1 ATP-binding cassette domain-containing protein [Vibrio neptunius]MBN3577830.1 ATP-binding cassette domain-containing protein [Vibrio neptunius]